MSENESLPSLVRVDGDFRLDCLFDPATGFSTFSVAYPVENKGEVGITPVAMHLWFCKHDHMHFARVILKDFSVSDQARLLTLIGRLQVMASDPNEGDLSADGLFYPWA